MNKWQIVGIVGAIIAIIGMFLPWATVSGAGLSVSVYGYISVFLWICAILTLIGAAIPKAWGGILAFIFGIIGFLDAIWNQMGVYSLKSFYESQGYSNVKISISYGGYVIMVGFIIALIGGILQYISIKKETKTAAPAPPAPPEEAKTEEENTESSQ